MLAKVVFSYFVKDCFSSSGGGWQLIPTERNREGEGFGFCIVVKAQEGVTYSVTLVLMHSLSLIHTSYFSLYLCTLDLVVNNSSVPMFLVMHAGLLQII